LICISAGATDAVGVCRVAIRRRHPSAEHAIRPAVVTRKVCGGNRSWAGADSQQILASVIRTASQRELNLHVVLASMLHVRTPHVAAELD
jgi:hypothetical protein